MTNRCALLKILKFSLHIFNGHEPVGPCRKSAKESAKESANIFGQKVSKTCLESAKE
jgi:hypothetical protein